MKTAMNSCAASKISARARRARSQVRAAALGVDRLAGATNVAVSDEAGETLVKLIDALDDHDDVQRVYGNYELSDALMAKLSD